MKITDEDIPEIIELSKTKSQKEVGELFDVSGSTIGRYLRKHGIKRKKSRLNMSRLSLDINYFKNIDTPKKAYWLGFICADGNIKKAKVSIVIKDRKILERFKNDINSGHKISNEEIYDNRTNKFYKRHVIQITNELFTNHIKKYVSKNKSENLKFPKINEGLYRYFIAGLFDGDGSVCYRTSNNYLTCSLISTKELLIFLRDYLIKNLNFSKTKLQLISDNKNVWKIYFYKNAFDFLNWIYDEEMKGLYLKRKYKYYEENK